MAGVDHNYRVDVGPMVVWTHPEGIRISNADGGDEMGMGEKHIGSLIRALDAYHRLRFGYRVNTDDE